MSIETATATASGPTAGDTRDRLISATEVCLRRSGIRRTTVIEIANEAGVSRAWLYKLFPDKASLVVAAVSRTNELFWSDARARVDAVEGLSAKVAAAITFSLEHETGELTLRLQADEPDAFAAAVGVGLREMVPSMALFWHPYLERARDAGEVRSDIDVARAAEWIIRIVLSVVTVPGDTFDQDDPADVRAFVDAFLVRGLQ